MILTLVFCRRDAGREYNSDAENLERMMEQWVEAPILKRETEESRRPLPV